PTAHRRTGAPASRARRRGCAPDATRSQHRRSCRRRCRRYPSAMLAWQRIDPVRQALILPRTWMLGQRRPYTMSESGRSLRGDALSKRPSVEPPVVPSLVVDVVSDVVCPWCYIGKRKLERALAELAGRELELEVTVRWHPFELNPDLPAEGIPR